MYKLSFIEQAIARLLFPAGGGEDIRPQLPCFCKSVGAVRKLKVKKQNAKLCNRFAGYFNSSFGSTQKNKLLLVLLLRNAVKQGRATKPGLSTQTSHRRDQYSRCEACRCNNQFALISSKDSTSSCNFLLLICLLADKPKIVPSGMTITLVNLSSLRFLISKNSGFALAKLSK